MLISEKQIMQLMDLCQILARDLCSPTGNIAAMLLDEITSQQSEELKEIT